MAMVDPLTRIHEYAPEKPEYVLGKGLMIPCNNHNAASRKKMWNVHSDHRTDVMEPEIAYMDTGYANEYARYNSALMIAECNYEVVAKISKFAHAPNHEYITVIKEPVRNYYDIHIRKGFNHITETNGYLYDNNYIDSKMPGDKIRQGDIIRKSTSYDEWGNKRDGVNLKTAYMNIGKTHQDGIVLSESARKKFDSPVLKPVRININNNNKPLNLYGAEGKYKVCPYVGEEVKDGILLALRTTKNSEEFYSGSQDRLRRIITSDRAITIGSGTVVDCTIYCNDPKELYRTPEFAQLALIYRNQYRFSEEIVSVLEPIVKDPKAKKSYDLEALYLYHRRILDGQPFINEKDTKFAFVVIEFMVLEINRIDIGDKMTNRYGGKGVVAGFLPDEEMPLLDNGKRVEAIANAAGVTGRLNPGQLIEKETNFISSRILELIRSGMLTMEQCFDLYLKFLSFVCPNQERFTRNRVYDMTTQEQAMYLEEISAHDAIHCTPEPISESYGIDLLDQMYKEFDWIRPYTVMVNQRDSMGNVRMIPTRRTLICGHIYYIRLKQHAEEKFSTTSLSATNLRHQNARSRSNKIYESPYSRTPIAWTRGHLCSNA